MSVKDVSIDLAVRYGFQVVGAVVILLIGVLAARWAGNVVGRRLERGAWEPPIRTLVVRAVRLVVLVFTLVVALDKFGFQVAPLVAGIGVAGLGIGIALQGVLSNLVAGLTIIVTKPFRIGEHLAILNVNGDVSRIELFSTTLVHPDQSRVIIPNRKIVGEILHNYGTLRQLTVRISIDPRVDLREALAVARETVLAHPRVLRDPEPLVAIAGVSELGIGIAVQPWVAVADYGPVEGELYHALLDRFRAQNIQLGQRELRLRQVS